MNYYQLSSYFSNYFQQYYPYYKITCEYRSTQFNVKILYPESILIIAITKDYTDYVILDVNNGMEYYSSEAQLYPTIGNVLVKNKEFLDKLNEKVKH